MKANISRNKKTNKVYSVILLLILALSVFSGCKSDKKKAEERAREAPVFAVNTTLAVQGQIQDYLTFSGDIVAGSTIDVYPEAAGKVTELFVSVGQRVSSGSQIASVDPSRPGMTFRQNIATTPISGTVVMIPAQVGMTVSQAVPLARIAGGGALEIKLNIAERFISRMAMNQPCEITLDAYPGDVFRGSISEVSPTVDLASRTMEVRVNVRDTSSKLKAGMFAKVRVITEQKNNIVKIPAAAVINRFGEQFVYVIAKDEENPEINIVKKRVVAPGILIDGVMEIQNGLGSSEEIVIRGQTLLDDGSRVNIIERLAPLGE
jgi:multidrug efflux pump subunit AcrA (membrane-fusion protein)